MIHSRVYFEDLYRHNSDPWGYDFHWYEARKRQICLALLTKPRYPKSVRSRLFKWTFKFSFGAKS